MTEINFLYCGKLLAGFEMSGHADDSQAEGEAVLCAALSSAAYLVANTITDILHVDADLHEIIAGLLGKSQLLPPGQAWRHGLLVKADGILLHVLIPRSF